MQRRGFDRAGYFVGYDYVFLGRRLRHGLRVYKLVLFDRRRAQYVERDDLDVENMWEVEGHYQPRIDGPIGTLQARMLHRDEAGLYHYFDASQPLLATGKPLFARETASDGTTKRRSAGGHD